MANKPTYDQSEIEIKKLWTERWKANAFACVLDNLIDCLGLVLIILLMAQCTCNGCIL